MPQILYQGITIDSHYRKHSQRNKCYGHHHNTDGGRHRDPHQFRIAHKRNQKNCLDGISGFHHTAEEFTGVRVVGRNRVDITVLFFFHNASLILRHPAQW